MKTLLFFRHAKSDWNAGYERDHERSLAPRGEKAAKVMGRFLAQKESPPESIIVSTAVRTQETLSIAMKAGKWKSAVRTAGSLYEARSGNLLEEIRKEPDATERLMLIGHEPSMSETVGKLIGSAAVRFPTAALARVDLEIGKWQEADFGKGCLIWLVTPKLIDSL